MARLIARFEGLWAYLPAQVRSGVTNFTPLLIFWLLWMGSWCLADYLLIKIDLFGYGLFLGSVGSAGYLFTLVAFTLLGDNNRITDASTHIITALAMGAAAIFTAHALGLQPSGVFDPSSGGNPINTGSDVKAPNESTSLISYLIPLFGLVLAVLLVMITLLANRVEQARDTAEKVKAVAQDAVEQARDTAEKVKAVAQDAVEQARDAAGKASVEGEVLMVIVQLTERIQIAQYASEELRKNANDRSNRDIAPILKTNADILRHMISFFSSLRQWILEPFLVSTDDLSNTAKTFKLMLKTQGNPNNTVKLSIEGYKSLHTDHWQPAVRLLEKLLQSIHTPYFSANIPSSEVKRVSQGLREVREELKSL
uniref:Uncharacterized protein n=1 Tax=Candidatus Kentrum sp. TC TaxID=2126339 RepID=A0A450YBD3_9GAMM|nr:MAG: hypothetical protein BECKTC1821D_GA0114238_100584 [Candidatus Kentron sp. TC]